MCVQIEYGYLRRVCYRCVHVSLLTTVAGRVRNGSYCAYTIMSVMTQHERVRGAESSVRLGTGDVIED